MKSPYSLLPPVESCLAAGILLLSKFSINFLALGLFTLEKGSTIVYYYGKKA